jgi:hypothetical protein
MYKGKKQLASHFLALEILLLLFFPKFNLVEIPGFSIPAKPEDLFWIAAFPLFIFKKIDFQSRFALGFLMVLGYLGISTIWQPSNIVLLFRMYSYALPILYKGTLKGSDFDLVSNLCNWFLVSMMGVAILQSFTPFPYIHTGVIGFGPIDRAPGIFGNGVEFSLVVLFVLWVLVFLRRVNLWHCLMAFVTSALTGTRVVTLVLLVSGVIIIYRQSKRQVYLKGPTALIFVIGIFLSISYLFKHKNIDGESRISNSEMVTVGQSVDDFIHSLGSLKGSTVSDQENNKYYFEFDDTLSADQSLAMRLSKMLFVIDHVILGGNKLGFGVGKAIGDAADNLYIRVLSDGGIPLFAMFTIFGLTLCYDRKLNSKNDWRIFLVVFGFVSLFYDTLYFSRVAPLVFIIIFVVSEELVSSKIQRN